MFVVDVSLTLITIILYTTVALHIVCSVHIVCHDRRPNGVCLVETLCNHSNVRATVNYA